MSVPILTVFKNRKRTSVLIALVAILTGGGVLFYGAVSPLKDKSDALKQKLLIERKTLRNELKALANEQAVKKDADRLLSSFKLPSTPESGMSELLSDIERSASQNNLKVLEIKPAAVLSTNDVGQMQVILSLDGKWRDLVHFFYQLEASPGHLKIGELTLESKAPQAETMLCRLSVIRIFIKSAESQP